MLRPVNPVVETTSGFEPQVRTGYSAKPVSAAAAAELRELIGGDEAGLAFVFASNHYDRDALADALRREFGAVAMIGCTTAGEIGPQGYADGGISGLTLRAQ